VCPFYQKEKISSIHPTMSMAWAEENNSNINNTQTTNIHYTQSNPISEDVSSSDKLGFVADHFGLFMFAIVAGMTVLVLASLFIREYYYRRYGIDVCPGTGPRGRADGTTATSAAQMRRDEELAQVLQRQLNDELREQDRVSKRQERQAWYEAYIKPLTMVRAIRWLERGPRFWGRNVRVATFEKETHTHMRNYSFYYFLLGCPRKGLFLFLRRRRRRLTCRQALSIHFEG
jgi:hypothetical protein